MQDATTIPKMARATLLSLALMLAVALLAMALPTAAGAAPDVRPCDIYANAGTPCVAAHSTTRALFAQYDGPLYSVTRASDGRSLDIGLLAKGDYADGAAQDAFCAGTTCVIGVIYDQSPRHNDLTIEGKGGAAGADSGAPADALPVTAGGHQVYGVSFSGKMGYRNDHTSGVAVNGQPESMYMVTSGTHVNSGCCFDYGNAETNNDDNGNGHMDALNFGTACSGNVCRGNGPWVHADLENGLFMSSQGLNLNGRDQGQPEPFVTAMLKNDGQSFFALKSANAQAGPLMTQYADPEPQTKPGYSPLHQEGAIVLGTGGDNSNASIGSFFEGVMTAGLASNFADERVAANIVGVGYGGPTGHSGDLAPGSEISLQTTKPGSSSYLSHEDSAGIETVISEIVLPWGPLTRRQSATWIVRRGFTDNACVAFEASDLPGEFLRHAGDQLVVQPDDGSTGFMADSTFCPSQGIGGGGSSFQAADAKGRYIRVYYRLGFIASDGGSKPYDDAGAWSTDVSFAVTAPLAP